MDAYDPNQPRDENGRWGEAEAKLDALPEIQYTPEQKALGLGGRGGDVYAKHVFSQENANVLYGGAPGEKSKLWTKKLVDVKTLIPTQEHIPREGLRAYLTNPSKGIPQVVQHNGKTYVLSGHTRIGVQILKGSQFVEVNAVTRSNDPRTQKGFYSKG